MKSKEHKFDDRLKRDKRLVEGFMREGYLDRKEFEKTQKGLPDESGNVKYIEVYEEEKTEDAAKDDRLTFTSG